MPFSRFRILAVVPFFVLVAACNTDPKVASRKYVESGNKYFSRAKYKEASIMYRRALSKDMRCADAWYRLGLTNLSLGMPAEARRDFSRAMESDPSNTGAIVALGDLDMVFYALDPRSNRAALADMKDLARQLFRKDPKSFDGLRLSGYIALFENDRPGAIRKFEQANQVKPLNPELVRVLVETLFQEGRNEDGENLAKELIEKQRTDGQIYDVLYLHYLRSNRAEAGEELLKKKIANNPAQGAYLLQLALHYYMTGRKAEMTATVERLLSDSKTFPDNHMLAGDFYARLRDFDSALLQYEQGQKGNGQNKRTYEKRIIEVLGTEGKRDQATDRVNALLKEDPKDPDAIAIHATLLIQSGDKSQIKIAIGELQPLVAKTPANTALHLNLGRAYMANGDPQSLDNARIQLLEALKIDPRYLPARLALAELQLARGQNAEAVQSAEEILDSDHASFSAHLIRATGLMNMRESQKAREELNTVLKLYPKSNDARLKLGELDFSDKRYQDAERDFQALIEANDPRGVPGLVETHVAQNHWDKAIQLLEARANQSPDRFDYGLELGILYARAGHFTQAIPQFQKLIAQKPGAAELYTRLGDSKRMAGDPKGAIDAFLKAVELAPRDAAARLNLALTYEAMGRYEEARKGYEEVIRLEPDNVEALNNIAYLKADGNVDLDEALAYAERARQKKPNDPNVADTVALIYIRKNLTDDSLRMLRELVSKKPDSPTFHLHLAMALYQKGDRPRAKKELETAIRNKPSEREQVEIKQLLAKVG